MAGWVDKVAKDEVPEKTKGRLVWQDLHELRTPRSALSEDLVAYAVEVDLKAHQGAARWVRVRDAAGQVLHVDADIEPRLVCIELFDHHYSLLVFDHRTGDFWHLDTARRHTNNRVAEELVSALKERRQVDEDASLTHADWVPKQASGSANCGPMVALMMAAIAGTDGDPVNVREQIVAKVSNDAADDYRRTLLDNLKRLFDVDDEDEDARVEDEGALARSGERGPPSPSSVQDDEVVEANDDEGEDAEALADAARMPWELPAIEYARFTDPRPVPRVSESSGTHPVPRSEFRKDVRSTHNASRLRLAALYLEDASGRRSPSCVYPDHVAHAALAEEQRFEVKVDDPAPQTIRWRIVHAKHLQRGLLELFVAGREEPVWRRELSAEQLRTTPEGEVQGGKTVEGGLAWTGSFAGGDPEDGRVRAESSPYKLKLTIFGTIDAVLATRQAWTYFDVHYQHKYSLLGYVPTTDFGCFGVHLDPARARLDVFIDALLGFLPVAPAVEPWERARRDEVVDGYPRRIRDDWSAQYELRCGDVRAAPVFNVHVREVVDLESMEGTENPLKRQPELLQRMDRRMLHFCAWFRDGRGRSGVMLHPTSASVNLFVPSAFEEEQASAMLSGPIINDDLRRLQRRVIAELREDPTFTGAGARVEVIDPGTRDERPRLVLPFARHVEALDPLTHGVALTRLAEVLNAARGELDTNIPVFVTGCMQRNERTRYLRRKHHDRVRAANVAAYLRDPAELASPDPAPPGATARQIAAGRGYVVRTKEGQLREAGCVEIEFGYTDQAEFGQVVGGSTAYSALVHEFGHMLGIPDEYMTYAHDDATKSIAASQPRLLEMCRARGLAEPVFPGMGAQSFHAALMSAGVRFRERYYLTVAEAVEKATSLAMGAPTRWDIDARGEAPAEATDEEFHDRFVRYDLVSALHRARRRVERHVVDPAVLRAKIQGRIRRADAQARIAYVRVVDRDTLAEVDRIGPGRVLIGVGVIDGDDVLHASIHARQRPLAGRIEFAEDVPLHDGLRVIHRGVARVPVTLRTDHPFDGSGLLTCSTRRLEFYADADSEEPLDLRDGHELSGQDLGGPDGVVLYMQGEFRGAELALRLRSEGHHVAPEVAVVELAEDRPALDVYALVHEPPAQPQPLSRAEMHDPGGVVLLDHVDARRPRTKITVHRPHGYAHDLVLRVRGPRVALFAAAKPGQGEVKLGVEAGEGEDVVCDYTIPAGNFDAKGRASFWLGGAAVSAASGDAAIELRSSHGDRRLARARLTVIDATLTATVPATRARTERRVALKSVAAGPHQLFVARSDGGGRRPPTTDDQVFDAARLGEPRHSKVRATAPYVSTDFGDNPPLVLIRGSLADDAPVRVDLALAPEALSGHVTWDISRAIDEDSDEAPPALAGAGLRRTFGAGATGSFHVCARLGGRPLAVLNVVLVEATLLPDDAHAPAAGVAIEPLEIDAGSLDNQAARLFDPPQPPILKVKSGDFRDQPCVRLGGEVRLIGGGPDGRRGLDQVYAGWVQNLTHVRVRSRYAGDRKIELCHVHNKDGASMLRPFQLGFEVGDSYFIGGDVADMIEDDVSEDAPILDTGNMGQGGADSTLGNSRFEAHALERGKRLVVTALDAPATEFFVHYPGTHAPLSRIRYEHEFSAYLCVWTNCVEAGQRIKTEFRHGTYAGDRRVAVLRRVDWSLKGRWRVRWTAPPGAGDFAGPGWGEKIQLEPIGEDGRLQASVRAVDDAFRRAEEAGVELYYPTELQVFAWKGSE